MQDNRSAPGAIIRRIDDASDEDSMAAMPAKVGQLFLPLHSALNYRRGDGITAHCRPRMQLQGVCRMRQKNLLPVTVIALSIIGMASAKSANATIIYDNLSVTSGSPPASVLTVGGGPLGDSFSTGATSSLLTDVKVLVDATTPSDGGSFTVGLYSDSSTKPGSLLDSLGIVTDASLATTAKTVDLPLSTPVLLSAGTRYWIVLSGTTGSGNWFYTTVNDGTGVANEYNYFEGAVSANSAFTPYQMQINVSTPVPEPASVGMLLVGVLGLSVVLRLSRGTGRFSNA